jgi:protein-S-isoprenylcysteine O-methyltransferase Ste14
MESSRTMHLLKWLGKHVVTALAASCILFLLVLKMVAFQKGQWFHAAGAIIFYVLMFFSFIFRYGNTESSAQKPKHWLFAISGTLLPLALTLHAPGLPWLLWLSLPLELLGMGLAIISLYTLGRSFGVIAANRAIKTHGVYRVIRHPLYTGEALWLFALVLQNLSWFNLAMLVVQLACQCVRLLEEEDLLKNDPTYARYMDEVSWRVIPGVF